MKEESLIKEVRGRLLEGSGLFASFGEACADSVSRAALEVSRVLDAGNKLLLFGNGGSASQAQHIAAEFVNRMLVQRRALPAVALNTDASILTSVSNDSSFDEVFSRQVEALGSKGDLAWGFSTSGSSKNVILGLKAAGDRGLFRLGLAGKRGSAIEKETDLCIFVESDSTPRIQEVHLAVAHVICELVDEIMFGDKQT